MYSTFAHLKDLGRAQVEGDHYRDIMETRVVKEMLRNTSFLPFICTNIIGKQKFREALQLYSCVIHAGRNPFACNPRAELDDEKYVGVTLGP